MEEGTSTDKMPLPDWPVVIDVYGLIPLRVMLSPGLMAQDCIRKQIEKARRSKAVSILHPLGFSPPTMDYKVEEKVNLLSKLLLVLLFVMAIESQLRT